MYSKHYDVSFFICSVKTDEMSRAQQTMWAISNDNIFWNREQIQIISVPHTELDWD